VLVLPAELTHAQATACCRMLAQALRSDPAREAVADASALRQFDSSALAVLLECRREALAQGKRFTVTGMEPRLRDLATLYGVAELLPETAAAAA
jgi:phospholipid transport system transporter-binding protein